MTLGDVEDICPLSPIQQGILFHSLYSQDNGMYLSQVSCTFEEGFSASAFERAWQSLIDRHSILRTAFVWEGLDEPVQVVLKRVTLPVDHQDWRGLPVSDQQTRLQGYLSADRLKGFGLAKAPLVRLACIQVAEAAYRLVWTYHHLLVDGWSEALLCRELAALYAAFVQGQCMHPDPTRSYGEYVDWLRRQDLSQAEAFWRRTLKGLTAPTVLSAGRSSDASAEPDEVFGSRRGQLSEVVSAELDALARQYRVTLNTLVQGAWALLLSDACSADDVVFGATVSGRPADLPGAESIIGPFINTLPVRVRVTPGDLLLPWLHKLQDEQAEQREYEYSPLVQVQGWSEIPRGQPLFDTLLVFQNASLRTSIAPGRKPDRTLMPNNVRVDDGWTNYALSLDVRPGPPFTTIATYSRRRFDDATVSGVLEQFHTILRLFVECRNVSLEALRRRIADADRQAERRTADEVDLTHRQRLKDARRHAVRVGAGKQARP